MAEMQVRCGLQGGGDAVLTSGLKSSPAQAITGLMLKGNWERFLPPGLGLSRSPLQSLSPSRTHSQSLPKAHFYFCSKTNGRILESWFLGNLKTEHGSRMELGEGKGLALRVCPWGLGSPAGLLWGGGWAVSCLGAKELKKLPMPQALSP